MFSLSSMDAYTCIFRRLSKSLYLLSNDSLIQRDQRSDPSANQDPLVATVEGRVNASHMLEVDESAKRDILPENDICQQGLDDIEGQRVKGIVEMRVAAPRFRLARKVDEVSGYQWNEESCDSPK